MDGGVFGSHNACRAVVACGGKKQGWEKSCNAGDSPYTNLECPTGHPECTSWHMKGFHTRDMLSMMHHIPSQVTTSGIILTLHL